MQYDELYEQLSNSFIARYGELISRRDLAKWIDEHRGLAQPIQEVTPTPRARERPTKVEPITRAGNRRSTLLP
ncbi:MAG: hypothetical protein V3R26_03095 [Hyphomicrobium sp.]